MVKRDIKQIKKMIDTLEEKMGVSRKISSFTIPLGATINMDGTSIMQGVAVIFVAQAYHVNLTLVDLITVILFGLQLQIPESEVISSE